MIDADSESLARFLDEASRLAPDQLPSLVDLVRRAAEADEARILVVDYALVSLQELGADGTTAPRDDVEGSLPGRAFMKNEIVVADGSPTRVLAPLSQDGERLGVLDLSYDRWNGELVERLESIVRVLTHVLIAKRRFTDIGARTRRIKPLSLAAEMQWDLLPPLSCSTDVVSVNGILEPAYTIGGDAFDFALNPNQMEFAIVDAVGHGMSAVSMSVAAINSLRNLRREGSGLEASYYDTGAVIATQFADSFFVTGQMGTLALDTGVLTWLNAGHPRPLLIRDTHFVGELECRPSPPMGLGGAVKEIASERLQPGDRVLFFTDGVIEARSPDGDEFGIPRLADLLVRATLDGVSPAETARRLSTSVIDFNHAGLNDDATMLLIDFHGSRST